MGRTSSKFKIETAAFELLVLHAIELEQLRRSVRDVAFIRIERDQQSHAQDFFAEVPFVEFDFQHGLIKVL